MMNPSSSGWIKKFFSLHDNFEELLIIHDQEMTLGEQLYGFLQPTGIIYGYPTNFIFVPEEIYSKWSNEEKFKVLLFESLIVSDYLFSGRIRMDKLEVYIQNFVGFYEQTAIEKAKRNWLNFKGADAFEKLESILDQRVDIKISLSHGLWTSYLHNSLVFQDLIFYMEYLGNNDTGMVAGQRFDVMMDMLKVVSVAAHADGKVAEEEEALFDILMASSRLQGVDKEEVETFWKENKTLNDIQFNYEMSWLMKRYFLEIATLTVWSDKVVTPEEQIFLDELGKKMMMEEDEQDKSFIAIQAFVLENAAVVPFLSGKNETEHFMNGAVEKWRRILGRNREKLAAELQQSKDLMALIAKSTTSDLTSEEKKRAKTQLKDLAKTIPAFTLFMLPGGAIIMPLVLKLIPDLVPSAFKSNYIAAKIEEKQSENESENEEKQNECECENEGKQSEGKQSENESEKKQSESENESENEGKTERGKTE
ncbi:MAG: LETM1-related biofilm-associated protein [Crocinitomicaceae bacterium]